MSSNNIPLAVVCDLDGTLCNDLHRKPALATNQGQRRWDEYHALLGEDVPFAPVVTILEHFSVLGHAIIFLTGRPDRYRDATNLWLVRHVPQLAPYSLIMRPDGCMDKSPHMKLNAYFNHIHNNYHVALALDDDERNANMWAYLNIPCLIPLIP